MLNVEIDYDSQSPGLLGFSVYRHEQAFANGEKLADRNPDKHSGVSMEEIPVEFREALESYYKEVEKNLE